MVARKSFNKCFVIGLLLAVFCLCACSNRKDGKNDVETNQSNSSKEESVEPTKEPMEAPTGEPVEETFHGPLLDPVVVPVKEDAVQVTVENTKTMQEIEGFGAAFTWYSDYLVRNKSRREAFDLLFQDAGLTILRFKNNYKHHSDGVFANTELMYYKAAKKRAKKRGEDVQVLLSSWTPSGDLKGSGELNGGSSIKKNANGEYVYEELGKYFYEAVKAYEKEGLPIDYLSIQNECDYEAEWEGCEYSITETDDKASYAKAYLTVYEELKKMADPPKMVGPETMSVDYKHIMHYMREVFEQAPESVYAIAHHLYNGGTYTDPISFKPQMEDIAKNYPNVSRWQTEFSRGGVMDTVEIIHNSMVYENLNAYIYWDGVWNEDGGLLGVLRYWDPEFSVEKRGFKIRENYYAMRHFSEFIRPGYKRVRSSVTDKDKKDKVLVSTYASKEQDALVAVVINKSEQTENVQLHFENYHIDESSLYLSHCAGKYKVKNLYQPIGKLKKDQTFEIPGKSVATIVLKGKTGAPPMDAMWLGEESDTDLREYVISARPDTPTLTDGNEEAWKEAQKQEIGNVANGDHGATAAFQVKYDREFLYVRVEVNDDTPSTSAKDISDRDSVEIFLNETNKKMNQYGEGDMHYRISRDNAAGNLQGKELEGFRSNVYDGKDGYVVEVAIPFVRITAVPGKKVGFDIQVNDSHGGDKRNYVLKWSDSSLFTDETLEYIGTIKFM